MPDVGTTSRTVKYGDKLQAATSKVAADGTVVFMPPPPPPPPPPDCFAWRITNEIRRGASN
jgi:hypothetical protein